MRACVLCGLPALLLLLALPSAKSAPPLAEAAKGPEGDLYQRAEKLCAANRLAEAEVLYRKGLAGEPSLRLACLNRLLPLYARLGRCDRAVQTALASRPWLRDAGELKRLRLLSLQLGDYYLQLGHAHSAERHLHEALDRGPYPLTAYQQVIGWSLRARAATRLENRASATRFWAEVDQGGRALLENPAVSLTARERIECLRSVVASYRQRGADDRALVELRTLYQVCLHAQSSPGEAAHAVLRTAAKQSDERLPVCETLRELAGLYAERGDFASAYRCLLGALDRHQEARGDRLTAGDLSQTLGRVCLRLGWHRRADSWRAGSIHQYETVLKQGEEAHVLAAFWRLHLLFQETSQYQKALALGDTQEPTLGLLIRPRLQAEQGLVQAYLGAFTRARELLRASLRALDEQAPANLIDLPRALNNLAVVEQATNHLDRAEELVRRCLDLCRRERLPADLVQVEAHNLLGSFLVQRGENAQAIEELRAGIALCQRLGRMADQQQSNLLLSTALLHKAQGDLESAFEACEKARALYRPDGAEAPVALAALDAALAGLQAARGRILQAAALADRVLARCRQAGIDRGPLVANALHYQALRALAKHDTLTAAKTWAAVRALQEGDRQTLLLPRTLNYQALIEERHGQPERAEAIYSKALALQQIKARAFPATHFITLWRLGVLADGRGKPAEARRFLEQALDVAEEARLRTYGDAQQRAGYLAQFAPAFEALVLHHLKQGDVEQAFLTLDRGRSRTLLDQLHQARVDPLSDVPGEKGQVLRRKEAELRKKLVLLRTRAQMLPVEALEDSRARQLLADLEEAQKEHAEVWREVLSASPLCRGLLVRSEGESLLGRLRQRLLQKGTMMLVYHLSEQQGHAMLLGGKGVAEVFPLQVSARVAERIGTAKNLSQSGEGTRGLRLRRTRALAPALPAATPTGANVPLTLSVARALIDHYLEEISDPDFLPTRGLRLRPRQADRPIEVQRLELAGDVFLPPGLRQRLRDLRAAELVVVPDGPLHKLPLEALLLQAGERPRYVLDELPPIVYAPSAAVLDLVRGRAQPPRTGPPSLLTVGNPAYRQAKGKQSDDPALTALLTLRGELPLLPGTQKESQRVRAFFERDRVTALEGSAATERAVVAALPGRTIVHLAVHGFADERFGNLFGALALAPPAAGQESSDNDGFLSLQEIYRLRLDACELAVLSACSTHVGPQRPLEAGVTLATAFLTAGAQRVVASHWSVDDRSTAELMSVFFAAITAGDENRVGHARALQQARRAIRAQQGWSAPYYWAPFVLVGQPDDAAK
jgi:CHAT domain-containing protein